MFPYSDKTLLEQDKSSSVKPSFACITSNIFLPPA